MTIQELVNIDIGAGMSADNVHDSVKHLSLSDRKTICDQDSFLYEVAIVNVTGELNAGNIIRTASLCGAQKVHILGRRKYDRRGTVGAENYIEVVRHNMMDGDEIDCPAVVRYFQDNNLFPIFVEQTTRSIQLGELDQLITNIHVHVRQHIEFIVPVFVFGNENRGVPEQLLNLMSQQPCVVVNQRGVIRSFNVGSTAAIVLHHVALIFDQKQKMASGSAK